MLLKDPAFRIAYEAESQNPQSDYQIVRHHGDGSEEEVFVRSKRMILNHCR